METRWEKHPIFLEQLIYSCVLRRSRVSMRRNDMARRGLGRREWREPQPWPSQAMSACNLSTWWGGRYSVPPRSPGRSCACVGETGGAREEAQWG
jgi:hypothetical protein